MIKFKILKNKTVKICVYPHCFKAISQPFILWDGLPINVNSAVRHSYDASTSWRIILKEREDDVINQVFKKTKRKIMTSRWTQYDSSGTSSEPYIITTETDL